MQKAAATHWQAAAWFLERAYPERFARRAPATLGPRQARELFDAVRKVVHSEVADPLLSMRLEERLRTPFQCFLCATGQNARTSRDLREVLKFFERKDGLEGLPSPFDFFARPAKPTGQPTPGPGPAQSSKTTAAAPDLQALHELRQKLSDSVQNARRLNKSLGANPPAPPQPSGSTTRAPETTIQ
jgi:hypothetical protein